MSEFVNNLKNALEKENTSEEVKKILNVINETNKNNTISINEIPQSFIDKNTKLLLSQAVDKETDIENTKFDTYLKEQNEIDFLLKMIRPIVQSEVDIKSKIVDTYHQIIYKLKMIKNDDSGCIISEKNISNTNHIYYLENEIIFNNKQAIIEYNTALLAIKERFEKTFNNIIKQELNQ